MLHKLLIFGFHPFFPFSILIYRTLHSKNGATLQKKKVLRYNTDTSSCQYFILKTTIINRIISSIRYITAYLMFITVNFTVLISSIRYITAYLLFITVNFTVSWGASIIP